MSLHLIEPPTTDVITLAEAKAQLRITTTTYDALITAMISAAVAQLDPAGGGWLGRALRPQTWELRLPDFYSRWGYRREPIDLPYPPLIDVVSVTYADGDGADQTLLEDVGFRVLGTGTWGRASIAPLYQGSWPSARCDEESVRIRYRCGYVVASDDDDLPSPIKQAVLLAIRDLWSMGERNLYLRSESVPGLASYEWTVSENAGIVIRAAAENLLTTYRVYD